MEMSVTDSSALKAVQGEVLVLRPNFVYVTSDGRALTVPLLLVKGCTTAQVTEDAQDSTDALVMTIGRDLFVTWSHAIPGTEQETVLEMAPVFHRDYALVIRHTAEMTVSFKW
jgi:hypothetical protein